MTKLRPHIQMPALVLPGGATGRTTAPHEALARRLETTLGRSGALRACRANGWAGALAVLQSDGSQRKPWA